VRNYLDINDSKYNSTNLNMKDNCRLSHLKMPGNKSGSHQGSCWAFIDAIRISFVYTS
jgi:hypothetical protein